MGLTTIAGSVRRFLLRSGREKEVANTYINTLPPEPLMEVVVRPHRKNRSQAQNDLMWLWLRELTRHLDLEHGISCRPEGLKEEFQDRFLGHTPYTGSDGIIRSRIRGTSELNTAEFTDFLARIEAYSISELGTQLPRPEDLYLVALARSAVS